MDHLTEIKIHRAMVGTPELDAALIHNTRVEIIDDINAAMVEHLKQGGNVRLLAALTRLKGSAMTDDFSDWDGESLYEAVNSYEETVTDMIEDYENNH
jgi:hypothetical protein